MDLPKRKVAFQPPVSKNKMWISGRWVFFPPPPPPQGFQQKVPIDVEDVWKWFLDEIKQQHKVVCLQQMLSKNNNEMELNAVESPYMFTVSESFVNMVGVKLSKNKWIRGRQKTIVIKAFWGHVLSACSHGVWLQQTRWTSSPVILEVGWGP